MIAFIPTKNRKNTSTYKLFEAVGIEVVHFIEPCEINDYNVPNKVSIEADNKGISYVRNFMLNYAKKKSIDWIVMCDDDIIHFGEVINGKCKKTDAGIWIKVLDKAKKLPFSVYGVNFRQYAWSEKKRYSINSSLFSSCFLINVKRTRQKFKNGLKQDYRFFLDCIIKESGVLKFNHLFLTMPAIGTNKGGLHEEYKNKKDESVIPLIVSEYSPFAKVVQKKTRKDVKVDIKGLAYFHNKKVL